ncbi:leucine-rich repeat-containing protein, variant [Capsaspora owczarzaki ATCC 30864]|uniref:Leucine-rich repeat-containing protein n=1 Tax=Capsaspora owczarzaki (strain ATCC 30864) TaxID=595528 RepID=E9CDF3_CAPO3|nr:leucine-rich repeat-containing protein [Capsaspora owczarzaki ATCC 30864]XP_011270588.1 leucine-rich repeat-containing protein, variant [Capsaspora owczarzaki ATCC 30864]KJE95721.1 leucine-rich repeat-containing protein [Capsaspora owczarzaki ATCC 30864]|eukprot:XP_004345733.2 leucine-rich repeat-containing protein [Capsaspora owczarzaki ATCC 30864]
MEYPAWTCLYSRDARRAGAPLATAALAIHTDAPIQLQYGKHFHGRKREIKDFPVVSVQLVSSATSSVSSSSSSSSSSSASSFNKNSSAAMPKDSKSIVTEALTARDVPLAPGRTLKLGLRLIKGKSPFALLADPARFVAGWDAREHRPDVFNGGAMVGHFLTSEVSGKGHNKTEFHVEVALFECDATANLVVDSSSSSSDAGSGPFISLSSTDNAELLFLYVSKGFYVNSRTQKAGADAGDADASLLGTDGFDLPATTAKELPSHSTGRHQFMLDLSGGRPPQQQQQQSQHLPSTSPQFLSFATPQPVTDADVGDLLAPASAGLLDDPLQGLTPSLATPGTVSGFLSTFQQQSFGFTPSPMVTEDTVLALPTSASIQMGRTSDNDDGFFSTLGELLDPALPLGIPLDTPSDLHIPFPETPHLAPQQQQQQQQQQHLLQPQPLDTPLGLSAFSALPLGEMPTERDLPLQVGTPLSSTASLLSDKSAAASPSAYSMSSMSSSSISGGVSSSMTGDDVPTVDLDALVRSLSVTEHRQSVSAITIYLSPKSGREGTEIILVGSLDFPLDVFINFGWLFLQCEEVIPGQRRVLKLSHVPSYEAAVSGLVNRNDYKRGCVPVSVFSSDLQSGSTNTEIFTYDTFQETGLDRPQTRRGRGDDDNDDPEYRDRAKRFRTLDVMERMLRSTHQLEQSSSNLSSIMQGYTTTSHASNRLLHLMSLDLRGKLESQAEQLAVRSAIHRELMERSVLAALHHLRDIWHSGDMNGLDLDGMSLLHYAAMGGRDMLVQFILQHGGDAGVLDSRGRPYTLPTGPIRAVRSPRSGASPSSWLPADHSFKHSWRHSVGDASSGSLSPKLSGATFSSSAAPEVSITTAAASLVSHSAPASHIPTRHASPAVAEPWLQTPISGQVPPLPTNVSAAAAAHALLPRKRSSSDARSSVGPVDSGSAASGEVSHGVPAVQEVASAVGLDETGTNTSSSAPPPPPPPPPQAVLPTTSEPTRPGVPAAGRPLAARARPHSFHYSLLRPQCHAAQVQVDALSTRLTALQLEGRFSHLAPDGGTLENSATASANLSPATQSLLQSLPTDLQATISASSDLTSSNPTHISQLAELAELVRALGLSSDALSSLISLTGLPEKLTVLPLSNNHLKTLPREIAQFKSLEMLLLDHNQLSRVDYVHSLPDLAKLWLHNNWLESIPFGLCQLKGLKTLLLHSNQITTIPPEFGELAELEVLSLDHNLLTSIPPHSLGRLTRMVKLNLNNNQLTGLPADIGNLTRLKTLSLHDNCLSSLPTSFSALANVKRLSLAGNRFATIPVEVCRLASLVELNMDNNAITAIPPALGELGQELHTLSLAHNFLTQLPGLSKLAGLRSLDVSFNKLTKLSPEIGRMTRLNILLLNDNQLVTLPPTIRIMAKRSLKALRLANNPLYSGVESLTQTYEIPSLFALCAQKIFECDRQEDLASLTPGVLAYLKNPRRCFICARHYFESPARFVSFVNIGGMRVPLDYELCSIRCVGRVQRGFVRSDKWKFAFD